MFSGLVTVRIEKDANYIKYIKMIREYDNSLSIADLKKAIDNGYVVFSFDSENNPIIADGKTNTDLFLETYFIRTLRALKKAGAKMVVTEEKYGFVCEEFMPKKKKTAARSTKKTDEAVMDEIKTKWILPENYLEYLKNNPKTRTVEIENEEDLVRIEICIYGAKDLIKLQDGYSYNPVEGKTIEDWNPNYVVIADSDADPYCIDITKDNAPVLFAEHGTGTWEFDEYSDSFEEFLEQLGIN